MKIIFLLLVALCFSSCSLINYTNVKNMIISKDKSQTFKTIAIKKAVGYASDPSSLSADIQETKNHINKLLDILKGNVSKSWGESDAKLPTKSEYVKYTNNYKSRASVDFDTGKIIVETMKGDNELQKAIVTTLLTPENPNGVDLYSDKDIALGSKPYLAGLVKDHQNKDILYEWRANNFAKYLVQNKLQKKIINSQEVLYVEINMTSNHTQTSSNKYENIAKKYAKKYNIDKSLILAIIRTESNFNPYAISSSGAYGLMQILPHNAGKDVYAMLHNKSGTPSKEELFNPDTNIEYGSAYLHILFSKYLNGINNPLSHEYCVIGSYNAGSKTVLNTFSKDSKQALKIINSTSPSNVYSILTTKMSSAEGRRYVEKVSTFKKDFR